MSDIRFLYVFLGIHLTEIIRVTQWYFSFLQRQFSLQILTTCVCLLNDSIYYIYYSIFIIIRLLNKMLHCRISYILKILKISYILNILKMYRYITHINTILVLGNILVFVFVSGTMWLGIIRWGTNYESIAACLKKMYSIMKLVQVRSNFSFFSGRNSSTLQKSLLYPIIGYYHYIWIAIL